ncbi:MAG: sulfite exporter TauE/SafE family protein [Ignavibacteriales bacterium]
MKTEIFKIDGMTCSACEKTIEKSVTKLEGVSKVKASLKNRNVTIKYDSKLVKKKDIIDSIQASGYLVVTEANNKPVIIAFIVLFGLYLIFRNTNLFNFIPEVKDNIGYGLLFIVGILTSIHCVAMCGGINISVSMNSCSNKYQPGLLYNLGRLTSYTIIGGIVGGIGSVIAFSNTTKDLISIGAGIFMIILGINMTGLFKNINILHIHLPKKLNMFIFRQKKNTKSPFIIGLLNGLMPCGPLQTMQLYALGTGSIIQGSLSMFFFALGTFPLMFGLSSLSGIMSNKMGVQLKKISGVLVVLLGFVMFNRGFDYTIITNLTKPSINLDNVTVAVMKDGYQEVTTRFENGQYKEIVVQKGVPVKWTIIMEREDINGCNKEILLPFDDIDKNLYLGDNLVEFTPEKVGSFKYTCWMNMLSSYIHVVEDITDIK